MTSLEDKIQNIKKISFLDLDNKEYLVTDINIKMFGCEKEHPNAKHIQNDHYCRFESFLTLCNDNISNIPNRELYADGFLSIVTPEMLWDIETFHNGLLPNLTFKDSDYVYIGKIDILKPLPEKQAFLIRINPYIIRA